MVGPFMRGTALGIGVAVGIGVLAHVRALSSDWPSDGGPTDRARHLGEAISEGMNYAFFSAIVLVPACVGWSLWRARRRAA